MSSHRNARRNHANTHSADDQPVSQLTASALEVGQQVFCPRHGIGVIRERRQRQILGHRREYLTIDVTQARMRIMLPAEGAVRAGLRPPSSAAQAEQALAVLAGEPGEMSGSWRTRTNDHGAKLSTGRITDIAEVVRDLGVLQLDKPLAASERAIHERARDLLIGDLMVAFDLDEQAAAARVDQVPLAA